MRVFPACSSCCDARPALGLGDTPQIPELLCQQGLSCAAASPGWEQQRLMVTLLMDHFIAVMDQGKVGV